MSSQQITTISQTGSSTDGGPTTSTGGSNTQRQSSTSGAYNPDNQFQGKTGAGLPSGGNLAGNYVAEGTHFAGFNSQMPRNYDPQTYNLGNLPKYGLDPATMQEYAPKSWYTNSSSEQLESLNMEEIHINDSGFQAQFLLSAPSYISPIVDAQPEQDAELFKKRYGNYTQERTEMDTRQDFPSGTPADSGYHIDPAKLGIGIADFKLGYSGAKSFYSALEGEETAAAFGESIVGAGESAAGWLGAEGAVAGAAELVGGTVAVGAAAASIGLVVAGGVAAYGLYEAAVGLGAPTISDDINYIGNGAKDLFSKIPMFNP